MFPRFRRALLSPAFGTLVLGVSLSACGGGGAGSVSPNTSSPAAIGTNGTGVRSLAAAPVKSPKPTNGLILNPTDLRFNSPTDPAQSFTSTTVYDTSLSAVSLNTAICTVSPPSQSVVADPTTGVATGQFSVAPVSPGACSVSVTDKKGNAGTVAVTVFDPTSIALTAAPNPATAAQQVTFSATVTDQAKRPVVGGSVTFSEGTTTICGPVQTNATGTATCSINTLAVGMHTVTASLVAFNFYTASVSPSYTETVNTGQKLYVANAYPVSVTAYPVESNGNIAPVSTISGSNTGLNSPQGIAVDSSGKIYVTEFNDPGAVVVYAAGANGNVAPSATISGSNTGLSNALGIAVDSSGNMYVANQYANSVTVYAPGANGNVAPTATIKGSNTGLSGPASIAFDSSQNIYVTNGNPSSVTVFRAGANGNVAPTATISGSATGLAYPYGIALDPFGNIYVANESPASVTVYAAGGSGNLAPISTISGLNTGLNSPQGIALDSKGNVYVGNFMSGGSVTAYASGTNGNVAPMATISGSNTGLYPASIAVH